MNTSRQIHRLFQRWNTEGVEDRSNRAQLRTFCLNCEADLPAHEARKHGSPRWYCNVACQNTYCRALARYQRLKQELYGPWDDEAPFAADEAPTSGDEEPNAGSTL